ncbi:TPA: RHS domain-containing protein, partial [Escherichia coli]|nr:RHS repeat-associated core domain-containing protein [Escherichia coli]EKM6637099.1 RHS domain-containing protein [Escherichia coli]MED0093307.1 RHS repeat-associated core domain-containing protein [Escherichia coli]HAW9430575.1 type IV secretion protein Rhs [Escherichia coli]HBB0889674.1 type IV secretion protein Rhs [Escherichia coli]
KETADGRTEYVHDAADQLLEIRRQRHETDAPEVIRFSYDRLGRMLSEETAQGILTHQYDELGNRTATTFPDGRTQRHLYYGSGHLQQINLDREVISEFTRDHLHREVLRSQGRLSTRQLYDPGGRLKRRETYSGMRGVVPETFTDRQYSYSGEDELLKTRHSRRGETDYFYDPTGRITACRSEDEGYLASWQYDAAGNLLGRRAGERATAENSVVPFNRLMSYRGVHYRYDEFGRAVEKEGRSGTQSYRYDAEHRMVEVTTARGTYRYVYDALGRRTEKQHISPDGKPYNRTKFLWDGMRLAQESRPEGTGSLYIYRDQGSYEPLARVDKAGKEGPNRILYFHTDVNGAPEEMTDSDGKIVWETGYQVWGNTIQEKDHGGVEQNLRYQGQYLDRETGLHYNLHRYYDPDVGRFMVTDPIGLLGGLNLYSYVPNPLSWIDPLGLSPVSPKTILFSQDSINGVFEDGRNVNGLIHRLINDPSYINHVEPIRKVRMRDLPANVQERLLSQGAHKDSVFTLDNRRLYAAKTAGVSKIPSRWATPEELSKINLDRRFSTQNGGRTVRTRGCG